MNRSAVRAAGEGTRTTRTPASSSSTITGSTGDRRGSIRRRSTTAETFAGHVAASGSADQQAILADAFSGRLVRRSFIAVLAGIGRLDWQAALAGLSVPILVNAGAEDFLERDPTVTAAGIAARAPLGRHVILEGCGHLPFVDRPALFCDTVRTWLFNDRYAMP